MMVPRVLRVAVDTSEQMPLTFPKSIVVHPRRAYGEQKIVRVEVERRDLKKWGADYGLVDYMDCCLVERKRKMRELHKNVWTADHGRFRRSLDRLSTSCAFPYLVLEGGIPEMYRDPDLHPGDVMAHLFRMLREFGIGFIAVGRIESPTARSRAGDMILRLMMIHADLGYFP